MVVLDLLRVFLGIVRTYLAVLPGCRLPATVWRSALDHTHLLPWNPLWPLLPVIAIGLFDRIVGAYTVFC